MAARVKGLFSHTSVRVTKIAGVGFGAVGRELMDIAHNVITGYLNRAEALARDPTHRS